MVNKSKIKLMTKLAIYEKNNKYDLKLANFFKGDYIKYNLLKTVLSVTAAYILCLLLVGFYNIEFLIKNAVKLDYKSYGIKILGIYAILLIIFCMTDMLSNSEKFLLSRKRLNRYYKRLRLLGKYYEDDNADSKEK